MQTPVYDRSKPVLVTGATGYVAGWIVKRLLEEGLTVHATARDPGNTASHDHLTRIAARTGGELRLFKADLLDPAGFDAAMAGCGVVMHTASPFITTVADPRRDLVDPAVNGTRNVLAAVNRADSVSRVVLTSSCAAIYGDAADCAQAPGGVLNEAVWNSSSDLAHNPYSHSKTLAERAAWEIAGAQHRWTLVAINPALVLGPGLAGRQTSESFRLIRQLGGGAMKPGVPDIEIGMVDVRDVAEAHLRAAFLPGAQGRHIVFAETRSFLSLAQALRAAHGDAYPLPRRELPKWLVWLVGPLANKALTRRFVARNVGHAWRADNGKAMRDLGMTWRPVDGAVAAMFARMVDSGQIARR